MSAPSSSTAAATYGGVTRWPGYPTFTMQNVVTVPVSGSSTSSVIVTPSAGHVPRVGTYTCPHTPHRCPSSRPSASPRR